MTRRKRRNHGSAFKAKVALAALRVIVKSGVSAIESSGGLIDCCYLDTIFEFDSCNHLRQVIEPAQATPIIFRAQPQLKHHVQHPIAGQATL